MDSDKVDQLVAITGVDVQMATSLLEACGGNLEMAVNMQMEDQGGGGGPSGSAGGSSGLTGGPSGSVGVASGSAGDSNGSSGSSVGDGTEDDVRAPIPQKQEVMIQPGFEGYVMNNRVNKSLGQRRVRSVFDGFRDFEAETRRMEENIELGLPVSRAKKRTLEELFKPPLDLMWQGDWQTARDHASSSGRWLLVNIQDAKEFQCQTLNRDLWSNPGVKAIVNEHFVFWQQYKESDEAVRYMTFYSIKEWPYVAIIDPRTGENMVTWSKIDAAAFPALMTEFLTLHPNLESPGKEPARKKIRTDNPVEMDEEAQMAAAIKASLAETMADRDLDSGSDLETFSDEESNQETSKVQNGNGNGMIKHGKDIGDTSKSSSDEKTKNSDETSDVRLGDTKSRTDDEENPACWSKFLGSLQDDDSSPLTNILIRFPDGRREPWRHAASSQLRSLLLFIEDQGFSPTDHEVVTNFPRVVVSQLDRSLTLSQLGLYPRETVFVQVKDQED